MGETSRTLRRPPSGDRAVKNWAPYCSPLAADYETERFRAATRRWRAGISQALLQDGLAPRKRTGGWVYRYGAEGITSASPEWFVKVYACVAADCYWPCVHRLLTAAKPLPCVWKYYDHPAGWERPDKIIFYAGARVRTLVARLRPLLRGFRFHPLRHAASACELGLEPRGPGGIFVGADPSFLEESWRMYRCLCVAWADLNRDYLAELPGGVKRWHAKMNISLEHEGPASLAPNAKNKTFIRRNWRKISPD